MGWAGYVVREEKWQDGWQGDEGLVVVDAWNV